MLTKKQLIFISAVFVISLLVIGFVLFMNGEFNEVENGEDERNISEYVVECPEDFSEGDIITLTVTDGEEEGIEHISVYLDGDRIDSTNRHGNIVVQAPGSSFEVNLRNGEDFEGDDYVCG